MGVATTSAKTKSPKKPGTISVYRALDGAIHHTRCRRRMTYLGTSASGLELEFYCTACHERVMLPEVVAAALPAVGAA
jgi:hypothetical protein